MTKRKPDIEEHETESDLAYLKSREVPVDVGAAQARGATDPTIAGSPYSINEPAPPEPPPGGGTEPGAPPVVTSLSPATVTCGESDFDLHVLGSGFTAESVINFAGYSEPTTFHSATEVTTIVKPSLWGAPATVPCYVTNPDGQRSAEVTFEFTEPVEGPVSRSSSKSHESKPSHRSGR